MKVYLLIPIVWVMLVVALVVWLTIREARASRRQQGKSLADRFLEANPGMDMDLTQDGVTTQHRPDVLEPPREWMRDWKARP